MTGGGCVAIVAVAIVGIVVRAWGKASASRLDDADMPLGKNLGVGLLNLLTIGGAMGGSCVRRIEAGSGSALCCGLVARPPGSLNALKDLIALAIRGEVQLTGAAARMGAWLPTH